MVKRFINDDVKTRIGSRNAVRITHAELRQKIIQRGNALGCDDETEDVYFLLENDETFEVDGFAREMILDYAINTNRDKECAIGDPYLPEDYELSDVGTPILGYHTTENGFTFFGLIDALEESYPIFRIIYWDGKKLRLYTPKRGNLYQVELAHPLACWCSTDADEDKIEKLVKKYKKAGIWPNGGCDDFDELHDYYCEMDEDDAGENVYIDLYLKKYGLNYETLGFNWDAIQEEIDLHFAVK